MRFSLLNVQNWPVLNRLTPGGRQLMAVALVVGVIGICLMPSVESVVEVSGGAVLLYLVLLVRRTAGQRKWLSFRIRPELVLLVSTIWVCLLVGEAILRICYFIYFPELSTQENWGGGLGYRHDDLYGWFPVPNSRRMVTHERTVSVAHNADGFRDAEPVFDSRPGIIFSGDSFVWGYNVEAREVFTDVLRRRHADWRVYNFGVCGYSTDQEFLVLQKHFERYHPRVVFLIFCTENDDDGNKSDTCNDWYFKPYYVPTSRGLELHGVPVPHSENVFYAQHSIIGRSYLVRLCFRAWTRLHYGKPDFKESPTTAILGAMRDYVTSQGAEFYVGFTDHNQKAERYLTEAKVPWLDLSTSLRVRNDVHWSPQGHQFVAGKIEGFLVARGIWKGAGTNAVAGAEHAAAAVGH